jgi:carbon-monoxide dehydrogenase medium subunit
VYAAPFDYFRAHSIKEAHQLLQQHPGAKLLAGGHSLIPLLTMRLTSPPALVDIGRIAELKGILIKDGRIRIGALATHAELAASDPLRTSCPMLAEAAGEIGDQQVRNWGTIGGNVVHADPASDLPTALSSLDAQFSAEGPAGERIMTCREFFLGLMTTSLRKDEVLTAIEVAVRKPGEGMAYEKFTHPASRYAVVGAAAAVVVEEGACVSARVSIGGLVPSVRRATAVEAALAGVRPTADRVGRAAEQVLEHLDGEILGDLYASAEYRRAMAVVYVRRALTAAFARAA